MISDDTINLLNECDAGVKMGISSFNEVMDKVQSSELRNLLQESRQTHFELLGRTKQYLEEYGQEGKDPAPVARFMASMKTKMKLDEMGPDTTIAALMTDGCNMGKKSLYKYINQYPLAQEKVKKLADDIAEAEGKLEKDLHRFL